jgi:hypothetical protein
MSVLSSVPFEDFPCLASVAYEKGGKQMQLRKLSVVLLALLLAAMAMVPMVSAEEKNATGSNGDNGKPLFTDHYISPDYFKDAKPAKPLPESEMMNIILSEKNLPSSDKNGPAGIITIPVSSLLEKSLNIESKNGQKRFVENGISPDDTVILVRMPKSMFDRFLITSKDGMVSLPASYFVRYYKNLADLDANVMPDGDSVQITPSSDPVLKEKTNVTVPEKKKYANISPRASRAITPLMAQQAPDTWHIKRIFFNRYSADSFDYHIGQITPDSWSASGNNDKYYAPQEREYVLNYGNDDAIEIVVNYDRFTRWPNTIISLFPTVFDNDLQHMVNIQNDTRWEQKGDLIKELNPGTFPKAYGYHVQILNGKYYITFEDMATLQFGNLYVFNDQDNPSTTFTEFRGSSEFYQNTSPITDTFSASTTPIIEEWTHDATLNSWWKPGDAWQYQRADIDELFTNIYWFAGGNNYDEIGTSSYMSSAWV